MNTIDTTLLHHLVLPETEAEKHPTLILLHGRGADEEDLLGLSEYLDKRLLLISARALFPFPYGGGYTWYDVGTVGDPDPAMFRTSYDALSRFMDDILGAYPVDRRQVFLLGFSMGTVMSYALSLTRPSLFRGVIANSGYIPEGTHLAFQWNALKGVNFWIAHGTNDPVIPIQFGRRAQQLLEQAGAKFVYHEYPIAHQISEESLADAATWLTEQLDTKGKV
jgi:phospholipase/carboxylesterase